MEGLVLGWSLSFELCVRGFDLFWLEFEKAEHSLGGRGGCLGFTTRCCVVRVVSMCHIHKWKRKSVLSC